MFVSAQSNLRGLLLSSWLCARACVRVRLVASQIGRPRAGAGAAALHDFPACAIGLSHCFEAGRRCQSTARPLFAVVVPPPE